MPKPKSCRTRSQHVIKSTKPPVHVPDDPEGVVLRPPGYKPPTPPTILLHMQGGALHGISATKDLKNVLVVITGDDQDCDPDNLVTLNPELPDFIYAAGKADEIIPKPLALFLHKQAKIYASSRPTKHKRR